MYCFIYEDINSLQENNPLLLQAKYAKHLGDFCLFNLAEKSFSVPIDTGKEIVIRGTCDNVMRTVTYLNGKIKLLESKDDINKIENWYKYLGLKRKIFEISAENFLSHNFSALLQKFYNNNCIFFVKSKSKNFSAIVSKTQMRNTEFLELIKTSLHLSDIILISECWGVKSDSLGKKEIRCFVRDDKIINCSRHIHSVKHAVPKSLKLFAEQIVKSISEIDDFPNNYVIDVAEFEKEDEKLIDIVEINPFSTSQCYINNSIFLQSNNIINDINKALNFGYEYCLDYLDNPERYVIERLTQENYEYTSDSHYYFV